MDSSPEIFKKLNQVFKPFKYHFQNVALTSLQCSRVIWICCRDHRWCILQVWSRDHHWDFDLTRNLDDL